MKNKKQQGGYSLYESSLRLFSERHIQACISSLGRLSRTPLATLMTVTVIGISLALPMGLYLILANVQGLSNTWNDSTQVSLFLEKNVKTSEANMLVKELERRPEIIQVHYISADDGLERFKRESHLENVLKALPDNPLPAVIEVTPSLMAQSPEMLAQLVKELNALSEVSVAKLDLEWVKRLYAMLEVARRGVMAFGLLLGLGVLLVVGNTIRLATQAYKEELEVIKLIGATNAFVRRPFLYTGFFYGVFGGVLAWLFVDSILAALQKPVTQLISLYHSGFVLVRLDLEAVFILLGSGALLGLLGSMLAVNRYLRTVDLH